MTEQQITLAIIFLAAAWILSAISAYFLGRYHGFDDAFDTLHAKLEEPIKHNIPEPTTILSKTSNIPPPPTDKRVCQRAVGHAILDAMNNPFCEWDYNVDTGGKHVCLNFFEPEEQDENNNEV